MEKQVQQHGINLMEYSFAKEAGSLALLKGAGENFVLQQVRYDPSTGKETDPILANLNHASIEEHRSRLLAEQDAINAALAQLEALETDMAALAPKTP